MTTTPEVWLNEFTANLILADTQNDPQIIGLSNGNFLVAWTDFNDTAASGTGSDIVGVIFDPLGNAVTGSLFLNNGFGFNRNVSDPVIAATNDGGFVLVYEFSEGADNDIIYGRYNAAGSRTQSGFIENDPSSATVYRDPSVAVRSDNSFVVSYESDNGNAEDIVGRVVEANGAVGARFNIRADDDPVGSTANPIDPDSATLTNDTVVTVFRERDGSDYDIEIRAVNADDSLGFSLNVNFDADEDIDPRIAALSGGGFVLAWQVNSDIVGRVYNANGTTATAQFTIAGGANSQNEPDIIGLEDGGFFAVWDNDTANTLEGARFNASGVQIGSVVTISSAGIEVTPELGLTSDGRVLITWSNNVDVLSAIYDPRENFITVDPSDGVTTGTQQNDTISGSSSGDTIYGVGGNDDINGNGGSDFIDGGDGNDNLLGGSGTDTILGGDGNDAINGGLSTDSIEGGAGDDAIFVSAGDFLDNVDGGSGIDELNHTAVLATDVDGATFDFVAGTITTTFASGTPTIVNIERYLDGAGSNTIIMGGGLTFAQGSAGDDTIIGSGANDTIFGGNDNDSITGGNGIDSIDGGNGDDVIRGGSTFDDTLRGGDGNDTLEAVGGGLITGDAGNDTFVVLNANLMGNLSFNPADLFDGGTGTDTFDMSAELSEAFTVDLGAGTIIRGFEPGVNIVNFERFVGSGQDDSIDVADNAATIEGGDGNDTLTGGLGAQIIEGGTGNDVLNGGGGGLDLLNGGDGDDIIEFDVNDDHSGIDAVNGGNGFDTMRLIGGSGIVDLNDTSIDFTFIEALTFGTGDQTIILDAGEMDLSSEIAANLQVTGANGESRIDITNDTNRPGIDISGWTFTDWNDTATQDVIRIFGSDTVNEIITGSSSLDLIFGNGGDDDMRGGDASDTLHGDAGNDTLRGEDGNDSMFGGIGDDLMAGNDGNDTMRGEDGNDRMFGSNDDDVLAGNDGNDSLSGDNGNDRLFGGNGEDTLTGGEGTDDMYGGNDADTMNGDAGNDTLRGENGDDRMFGGTGDDLMAGNDGQDTMRGDDGNDRMFGSNDDDVLAGNDGDDSLDGGTGNDRMFGGNGQDTLEGGDGADDMYGGNDADTMNGNAGNDTLRGENGDDRMFGGTGDDLMAGNDGQDTMRGDDGDDRMFGSNDDDVLAGNDGNDRLSGDNGNDRLFGGEGNDTLIGGAGQDEMTGNGGADVFVFNSVSDSPHGATRDTIIDFDAGVDFIDLTGIGGLNFVAAYTGAGNEVRYNDGIGRLYADIDGDGLSDFSVDVGSGAGLTESDLVL